MPIRTTITVLAMFIAATAPAPAETLYRYSGSSLFDGAYGPIARAQGRVREELASCGSRTAVVADGRFGPGTRDALRELARCPRFSAALAGDAQARAGDLTALYWRTLVSGDPPDLGERARTVMLTYEATDYTRAEWNFCQSKPLYDPIAGRRICYSNDPRSYITWGPNGATAGGGREVQLILAALDRERPELLSASFGGEADAVRRTFILADRTADRVLETYLCGVWASPARRAAWRAGFDAVGRAPETREIFDRLYASRTLDGGKIATFYREYRANGLIPTEVDFAFFKDRAAHTSPDGEAINQAISAALAQGRSAPWQIRRSIALRVRPSSQREDRLGRDVAFFVDSTGPAGLTPEEATAWRKRGPLRASDAGLSDARTAPDFQPGPAFDDRIRKPASLTVEEMRACPAAVLATRRP